MQELKENKIKPKILVVDDIEENLDVVKNILDDKKYDVFITNNGADALKLVRKELPDLVLLDIMMPEMDGYDVILEIKKNSATSDIPVIFLTAIVESENITKAFEIGAVDYIAKPFNASELNARVNVQIGIKLSNDTIKRQKVELENEIEERKITQQNLFETKEQLNSILENANEAVFVLQDRKFRFFNKKTISILGQSKKDILNTDFLRFAHPSDKDKIEELYKRKIKSERLGQSFIFRIINANNKLLWVKVNSKTINWNDKPAVLVILDDITDYQKAQEEIKQNEEKFRRLFEQSNDGIIVHTLRGEIINANEKACSILNFNKEELLSMNLHAVWPDNKENVLSSRLEEIKLLESLRFESAFKKSNGNIIEVEISSKLIDKKRGIVQAIFRDISLTKTLQNSLKESERYFRLIYDSMPYSIFTIDLNGIITDANPETLKLFGTKHFNQLLDRNIQDFLFLENSGFVRDFFYCIKSGKTVKQEYSYLMQSGNKKWINTYLQPVLDKSGCIQQVYIFSEDITQKKELENKVIESEKHFRLLYENSPLGILTANSEGTILDANSALLKLVDLNATSEAKEINILQYPLFKKAGFSSDFIKCVSTGEIISNTYKWKLSNSRDTYFWNYLVPLKDKNDNVEMIYVIVEDITKRVLAEEQVQLQKKKIETAHKDILSSINYAKVIQKAVLPVESFMKQLIPESFVLYIPRDLVSGDFYWIKQVEHKIFIVAADCTGHGVPGGFLSMLGISLLNEIISSAKFVDSYEANQILNQLRKKMKRALHQNRKEDTAVDGMDMALTIIDQKNQKMQYAGANMPLLIIRKNKSGKPEIIHYKPDAMPIGIYVIEKSFTNHDIQLYPDDLIYMFSDGYVDQFKNWNGRKYTVKRLKEFLLANYNKPLDKQKELLYDEFNRWKGEAMQLDDVLIMGMKIRKDHNDMDLYL